jgi:hypothetical protein
MPFRCRRAGCSLVVAGAAVVAGVEVEEEVVAVAHRLPLNAPLSQ